MKTNFGEMDPILVMQNVLKGKDFRSYELFISNPQGQARLHKQLFSKSQYLELGLRRLGCEPRLALDLTSIYWAGDSCPSLFRELW